MPSFIAFVVSFVLAMSIFGSCSSYDVLRETANGEAMTSDAPNNISPADDCDDLLSWYRHKLPGCAVLSTVVANCDLNDDNEAHVKVADVEDGRLVLKGGSISVDGNAPNGIYRSISMVSFPIADECWLNSPFGADVLIDSLELFSDANACACFDGMSIDELPQPCRLYFALRDGDVVAVWTDVQPWH